MLKGVKKEMYGEINKVYVLQLIYEYPTHFRIFRHIRVY